MTLDLQERLNQLRTETEAPVPAAPTFNRGANLRPNKYGGSCQRCSGYVEAGAGHIAKGDGKWLVFHNGECPPPQVQRPVPPRPAPGPRPAPPVPVQPTTPPIRHGIYTAVTETGRATFKISHQAEDADFAPGRDILGVMLGSDNTQYTSIGFVNAGHVSLWRRYSTGGYWWSEALAQLIADPDAALESLKCRRCNRDLTTPESLAIGIGPECAKMVGL